MKKSVFAILFAALLTLVMTSCYEPSPLYGTWGDNQGNKITFIVDGTFSAFIYDNNNQKITYSGDYTVIENVISFGLSDGSKVVTEWDIRGSLLYLTWATEGTSKSTTLYHISK